MTLGSSADEEDSILSSQYSDKNLDSEWMRKYSIRKLKKLVDKCCRKRIHFPKKFCEISKQLAKDPDLISDNEIIELRTECFESLNNIGCMSESNSSSSDSSSEKLKKKKKKSTNAGLLVNSPPELDPTNPYTLIMLHTVITVIQKPVTMEQLAVVCIMAVIRNFALELQAIITIIFHVRTHA